LQLAALRYLDFVEETELAPGYPDRLHEHLPTSQHHRSIRVFASWEIDAATWKFSFAESRANIPVFFLPPDGPRLLKRTSLSYFSKG
jgi:hypothetical protein